MPLEARPLESSRTTRLLASAAMAALLALSVAGCKTTSDDVTGSIGTSNTPRSDAEWRQSLEVYGARYRANPDDADAAIAYARGLRATDQRAQAVAVLEQASIRNSSNMTLLGAYGRALAETGDLAQAFDVLSRAHTPDNPDWRVLNAQGAVLDQLGRHAEAQKYYSSALKIVPDEPSVLSNLGLSYVLIKDLKRAEVTLRRARGAAQCRPEGAAEPCAGRRPARQFRRGRKDRARRPCRRATPPPMSAICARCWRNRKTGRRPAARSFVPQPNPGG